MTPYVIIYFNNPPKNVYVSPPLTFRNVSPPLTSNLEVLNRAQTIPLLPRSRAICNAFWQLVLVTVRSMQGTASNFVTTSAKPNEQASSKARFP